MFFLCSGFLTSFFSYVSSFTHLIYTFQFFCDLTFLFFIFCFTLCQFFHRILKSLLPFIPDLVLQVSREVDLSYKTTRSHRYGTRRRLNDVEDWNGNDWDWRMFGGKMCVGKRRRRCNMERANILVGNFLT